MYIISFYNFCRFSGTIEHLKVCNNNLFNIIVSKIPGSSSFVYSLKRYDLETNSPTDGNFLYLFILLILCEATLKSNNKLS